MAYKYDDRIYFYETLNSTNEKLKELLSEEVWSVTIMKLWFLIILGLK